MFQIYEIFKRLEQNVMDQKIKLTILAGGQQVESHSIGMRWVQLWQVWSYIKI